MPQSDVSQFVSAKTTGMEVNPITQVKRKFCLGDILGTTIERFSLQYKHLPVVAGLGYKAKEAKKKAKPRTLQEKREQVESDVKKYGREAVSKMYAAEEEAAANKRRVHHRCKD